MNPTGIHTYRPRPAPTPKRTPAPRSAPLLDAWITRERAQKAEALRARVLAVCGDAAMADRIVAVVEGGL